MEWGLSLQLDLESDFAVLIQFHSVLLKLMQNKVQIKTLSYGGGA